jgi:hypothetical protein
MLRRAPTTITLTSADVEQYEHNRQRKHWERQQQQEQTSSQSGASQSTEGSESGQVKDQNEDLKQAARDKMKRDRIMGTGR